MRVQNATTEILNGAGGVAGAGGVDAAKLRAAKVKDGAQQFEAMMLGEMLKPMKFGESPDAGAAADDSSGEGGILQSYGTEALAKAIASQGGFGLARQIIRQVTAEDQAKGAGGSKV